jgi:phosphoenolpyruvate phosphomutase
MKALILNSGMGRRMGKLAKSSPKCMIDIYENETILSRQLRQLVSAGITEIIITTGAFGDKLEEYCYSLNMPIKYRFVHNKEYAWTNYIYSIYCAHEWLRDDDILLLHGDLVFEEHILDGMIDCPYSCMAVDIGGELSQKDFKAVLHKGNIVKIGVEYQENAVSAQPLYKLWQKDWTVWLDCICRFCETGNTKCYAEEALNEVTKNMELKPYDVSPYLCNEIDNEDDYKMVSQKIKDVKERFVYMGFSTDVIHSGHIEILKKAACIGKVVVGVLSDSAVASYKRFPLVPFEERKALLENLRYVHQVVEQKELNYRESLLALKPAYVVHGDDWQQGIQKPIRDEVIEILQEYGGKLIEFPYAESETFHNIEKRMTAELAIPDLRRGRLKKAIQMKGCINAIEVHSGITGLIAEKTMVEQDGKVSQFDAMWVSSLCDSTAKGKPDIELVDITSRLHTIDDIMEVTTKPIIFDGDTGGLIEHFTYTVKTLERMGVSMVIIEDKTGLKKNSLFGNEIEQTQDTVEHFCSKIEAGKRAKKTNDFMIVARIESLILEKGMEDALKRAEAYVKAGADGIMIHSRKKEPDEILEFVDAFRRVDIITPLVVVPTTFNTITEEEFARHGINVVIYANQLTRSGFPAMKKTAELILQNHRAKEADEFCMPIKDIINLIPSDE